MKTGKKILAAVAPLVGLGLFAGSAKAATLSIYLQEDGVNGGNVTLVATGPGFSDVSFTGTYGDFSVRVFGSSADNGIALSDLLASTTSVTNTDNSNAHTLHLYASEDDYTLPLGSPVVVESGLGGTQNTGTVGLAGIYQAYYDPNNALLGQTFTNGLQNANLNGSTFDTGSATNTYARTGNYSLTSVVNFNLSAGGKANFSDHINVTAPLPASSQAGLALLGAFGLVQGAKVLRRKGATA